MNDKELKAKVAERMSKMPKRPKDRRKAILDIITVKGISLGKPKPKG